MWAILDVNYINSTNCKWMFHLKPCGMAAGGIRKMKLNRLFEFAQQILYDSKQHEPARFALVHPETWIAKKSPYIHFQCLLASLGQTMINHVLV